MYTIRAVAVGNLPDQEFAANPNLTGVRPYITGLINWLEKQPNPPVPDSPLAKYKIGEDYVIEYRERDVDALSDAFSVDADLFFCMSTSVGDAAVDFTLQYELSTPIVVITSDVSRYPQRNVCGVSGLRYQYASSGFDRFKKAANLTTVYALHRVGYPPSEKAMQALGNKVSVVKVHDNQSLASIINSQTLTMDNQHGLLVLPADRFFGAGGEIVTLADNRGLKSFWSTPDWPPGAFGGYGYRQLLCGQFMAERVASIWSNNNRIPDPPFVTIDPGWLVQVPAAPRRAKTVRRSPKGKRRKSR
jgi:hypothetical protein